MFEASKIVVLFLMGLLIASGVVVLNRKLDEIDNEGAPSK